MSIPPGPLSRDLKEYTDLRGEQSKKRKLSAFDLVNFKTGEITRFSALQLILQNAVPWRNIYEKETAAYRTKVVRGSFKEGDYNKKEIPDSVTAGLKELKKLAGIIESGQKFTPLHKPALKKIQSAMQEIAKRHEQLDENEAKRYYKAGEKDKLPPTPEPRSEVLKSAIIQIKDLSIGDAYIYGKDAKIILRHALERLNQAGLDNSQTDEAASKVYLRNRACFTHAAREIETYVESAISVPPKLPTR